MPESRGLHIEQSLDIIYLLLQVTINAMEHSLQEVMTVVSEQTRFPEIADEFSLWSKTWEGKYLAIHCPYMVIINSLSEAFSTHTI